MVITAIAGVALAVVLSATVMGIDLGLLGHTATEVRKVPDVTVLAGTVGETRTFLRDHFGRVFRDLGDTVEGGWISSRRTLGGVMSEHPGTSGARRDEERH